MIEQALEFIDKPNYRALIVFPSHTALMDFYHERVGEIVDRGGAFNMARLQAVFPSGATLTLSTDKYPERHYGVEYQFVGFVSHPDPEFQAFISSRVRSADSEIPVRIV